jgi:hypothetical protein
MGGVMGTLVSILLIAIAASVVLAVMYFGTRETHSDETQNTSEKS